MLSDYEEYMLATQGQAKQSLKPLQGQDEGDSNANVGEKEAVAIIVAGLASDQMISRINPVGKGGGRVALTSHQLSLANLPRISSEVGGF